MLTAFAVRQYYYDEGTWVARESREGSTYVEQRLAVVGLAFVVSVVCLSAVAALWAFFIAKDVSSFKAILVEGRNPFLLFYPSMALVTLPLVWLTLTAADARADSRSAADVQAGSRSAAKDCTYCRSAVVYGVASAALIVAFLGLHLAFWYGWAPCRPHAVFLTDMFAAACFLNYGGLDYFVMPILAYLAAVVFGNPRPASHLLRRWRLTQRGKVQAAMLALALVSLCLAAPAALAQGIPAKSL